MPKFKLSKPKGKRVRLSDHNKVRLTRTLDDKVLMGRPLKYSKYHPQMVFNMALLGLTEEETAKCLDISYETFNEWKNSYPEFSEALKEGKAPADAKVARGFFNRAAGFEKQHEKLYKMTDADGNEYIHHEPYTEYYAPDAVAANRWLANRQRQLWSDKNADGASDKVNPLVNLTFNVIDPVEAANVYQKLIQGG